MKSKKIFLLALFLVGYCFQQVNARDSKFTRKGNGPLYWTSYEYCNENDAPMPEERWKKNIDWMARNFKAYGYDMICNDGWIEGAQTINDKGYIIKYNSEWLYDFKYWNNYIAQKGMKVGVYYNPLWLTKAAYEHNCQVKGTKVGTQSIVGSKAYNKDLYWVDTDKKGAEQWIKGYVRHFIDLGMTYLRIDFLENYEGKYGSEKYAQALKWIKEEAGDEIFLSLVMPNCYNDAKTECKYGDMIRVSDDCYDGGWDFVSNRKRGVVQSHWPRYWNIFDGFIGFSKITSKGKLIMDGDFMRMHTMPNKAEKQFLFSLMVMTGSALAIADQYDTIGEDAWVYQNQELLDLHRQGFVASPVSTNSSDVKNSTRWIGQMPNGDWVVGLFNRQEASMKMGVDFKEELGVKKGALMVRDLWSHQDLGEKTTGYSVVLQPHSCKIIRLKSNASRIQKKSSRLAMNVK